MIIVNEIYRLNVFCVCRGLEPKVQGSRFRNAERQDLSKEGNLRRAKQDGDNCSSVSTQLDLRNYWPLRTLREYPFAARSYLD